MKLRLTQLPDTLHGPDDPAYKGMIPRRARFLAPDAAISFLEMHTQFHLVCSDIFRSAESSLAARLTKRGVQPPAYSGHNYGLSIDVDIDATLKARKMDYLHFVAWMVQHGWFCHRQDGKRGAEDWHFNFLGSFAAKYLAQCLPDKPATWSNAIEAVIVERYGSELELDAQGVQGNLAKLGFYHGDIDGLLGPLSKQSIAAFQRAWLLGDDGLAGPRTKRTLAYVAADTSLV